jgi:hypothetical protein
MSLLHGLMLPQSHFIPVKEEETKHACVEEGEHDCMVSFHFLTEWSSRVDSILSAAMAYNVIPLIVSVMEDRFSLSSNFEKDRG